jgi:hypothetical protein
MKKILFVSVSFMALFLTSCLKDKNIEDRKYGTQGLGEIPLVMFPSTLVTTSLNASDKDTTFHLVTVRLAEANPASEDIKVTLTPNNAAVTAAGFKVAPASAYTLDNLVVTIPKGQREGYVTITTKTSNLATDAYGFGFDIASISNPKYTIASTYKTTVAALPIKNKWDGVYEVSGTMVDKTNATLGHINKYLSATGSDPQQWELRTIGPATCVVYDNYFFGGNYAPISSGASYSQYGSFSIIVEFDPATDKVVKVTNYYGQPAANGRYAQLDPTGINKYDPATKTVDIKYNLVGGPGVGANEVRSTWTETWTWIGDR